MILLCLLWYIVAPASTPPARALAIPVAPGETLTVHVTGTGVPIVAIPGLFGSAEGFRPVAQELGALGYQFIAIEPLGVGTSSRPRNGDYSLTAQAIRVAAVLDSIPTGPVLVVAHSTGAAVAYRLALLRPDAVRGIVSLEGGPVEQVGTPGLRRALSWAPLLRLLGAAALRGRVAAQLRDASGDPSWVTDSIVSLYAAGPTRDLGATLRALKRMVNAAEPWSLAPVLNRITVPVHLVLGAAPHRSGPSDADVMRLAEALPSFTLERWEGVGHYAFAEAPARVVDVVLRVAAVAEKEPNGPGSRPATQPGSGALVPSLRTSPMDPDQTVGGHHETPFACAGIVPCDPDAASLRANGDPVHNPQSGTDGARADGEP